MLKLGTEGFFFQVHEAIDIDCFTNVLHATQTRTRNFTQLYLNYGSILHQISLKLSTLIGHINYFCIKCITVRYRKVTVLILSVAVD